jgi:hypothetical protein
MGKEHHKIKILDVTRDEYYSDYYLYRCLSPMPFRIYKRRKDYLEKAIPAGFHKKILFLNGDAVGQIEYGPPEASPYPIFGDNIIVMNCIWVLRRAKGYNLGKLLIKDMVDSESWAESIATIGLKNHWSGWLKKEHMEMLGFKSIDFIKVRHKYKHQERPFELHLMWLRIKINAELPKWRKENMMKGVLSCMAHPLYNPIKYKNKEIFELAE